LTVIVAANSHTGAIDLLRAAIPRLAAGERVSPPPLPSYTAVALGDDVRRRLEGDYDTGGGSISTLRFHGPSLALFGDRALVPLNDSTFLSTADYAKVVFSSTEGGGVEIRWGTGTWATHGEDGPRFARLH
jgi:hypothetical protein